MSAGALVWQVHPDVMADAVDQMISDLPQRVAAALQPVAAAMLGFMQSSHPWTNRTGEAEAGLNTVVLVLGNDIALVAYHTAPHGVWLEFKHGGVWGVIPMAMDATLPQAIAAVMAAILG